MATTTSPSKTAEMPGLFDFDVKREASVVTPLRAYAGWTITKYRDEFGRYTFSAAHRGGALSPLEGSWEDALHFVKHGEPVVR